MDDLITRLKVKNWYHALTISGTGGVIASLSFNVSEINNLHVFIFFLGVSFLGYGEWINHPHKTALVPPNPYTGGAGMIKGNPRDWNFVGLTLDILGICLAAFGLYKILQAA